jgi:hypothetical protein
MKRLAFMLLLACGPVDVVVADVPMPPPMPCAADAECGDGFFCEHPRCEDSFGFCREVSACNSHPQDVCDCSGQHYSSDCEREQAHKSPGPC